MMFATLTLSGLSALRHEVCAPLWRRIVTIDNAVLLNWLSALVVAACFVYVIKKLVFQIGPTDDPETSTKRARVTPYLTWIPLLVVPALIEQIVGLSPFFFSLMPGALSLALMCSLNQQFEIRDDDDEGPSLPSLMWLRLILAGACAAVGVWEGTLGIVMAVVSLFFIFLPSIHRTESVSKLFLLWSLGFLLAFFGEGIWLDWPWLAFSPSRFPIAGTLIALTLALLPVLVVRVLREKWWILLVWCVVLAVLATNALLNGRYWQVSGCERFARKVLTDLGDRKLIIGDGFTDDFFRELKPADVRLLGSQSFADREILISLFDADEPVTNRALVVREYHHLPEADEVARELGLAIVRPTQKSADDSAKSPNGKDVSPEALHAQAVTNELLRIREMARPLVKSINEMMVDFAKIPAPQRKAKIEEARANIRKGWKTGFYGDGLSSTVLTLDLMLGDLEGAEADALMALMYDRNDPAANAMLGNIRLRKGQLEKAELYLRKGAVGGGVGVYNDLAMLLLKTNRAQEAEEWARKAIEKMPNDWNVHETLVQVLIEKGQIREAEKELIEVERLAKAQNQLESANAAVSADRSRIRRLRNKRD